MFFLPEKDLIWIQEKTRSGDLQCVCVCVNTICALYVSIHVATLVLSGDLDRRKDVIDIT